MVELVEEDMDMVQMEVGLIIAIRLELMEVVVEEDIGLEADMQLLIVQTLQEVVEEEDMELAAMEDKPEDMEQVEEAVLQEALEYVLFNIGRRHKK